MNIRRQIVEAMYKVCDQSELLRSIGPTSNTANILMFHRVNDYDSDGLTTPTPVFEEMMRELKKRYQIVSLSELVHTIRTGGPLGAKVVITFDDGYRDNLNCAAPILKRYDIPATFFVTTGFIDTQNVFPWDASNTVLNPLMTWGEVRSLAKLGFEIGAHTVTHPDLGATSHDDARREIRAAKQHIERELGQKVNAFAFPFGRRDCCPVEVSKIVREEGYASCCLGYGGKVRPGSDPFRLNRIPMYPTTIDLLMEVDNFLTYFDGTTRFVGVPVIRHKPNEW